MRLLRTSVQVVCAAATLCALVAGSASAVQVKDGVTGTALAPGASLYGATTTTATLTGTFFGLANVTVKCDSVIAGTVTSNPDASGFAVGSIDTLSFYNCTDGSGGACTVSVDGLPWTPTSDGGNGGGLVATSTTTVDIATGSGDIDISNCLTGLGTCKLQGGTAGPNDGLDNYITATWDATAPQLTINTTNIKNNPCTSTGDKWVASYDVTDAANNRVILQ